MKSILRSLAVLAVLVGFTSSSFAQDDNDIIRPITKQGSAAFLFTINGLGTFGIGAPPMGPGMMPAGFGFKYFLADDVALRVLIGFSSEDSTIHPIGDGDDITASRTSFGVGVGAEYHFRPLYSTSPYIGAQIGFTGVTTNNGLDGAQEVINAEGFFSIMAIAGFDWFFTRGISVGAEYGFGLVTSTAVNTQDGQDMDLPSKSFLGFNGVGNVNLDVYF